MAFDPAAPQDPGRALSLEELDVVVLDCQTTGANPERGHLLEVAWSRGQAGDPGWRRRAAITSHLVRLPRGRRIPARISTLTGIRARDLASARPPAEVWRRLRRAIDRTPFEAVAHFARFEQAFLQALHADHDARRPFPLHFLCTHDLVCRLMPGLPRRGLRAVAGRLGHVMEHPKRAAAHVRATIVVWTELLARLRRDHGVTTLEELHRWREAVAPVRPTGRDYPVARQARLALPDAPGVYRMRARNGRVLYLGKATSLRRRVNSYFQHRRRGADRTPEMLTQTFAVDVTVTGSALEAALRETDEIKEHAPLYNVALQERPPQVWFASPDLAHVRTRPDDGHRLGPLPRPDALTPLVALRTLLTGAPRATAWRDALGLREGAALDRAGLRKGLARFRARHPGPRSPGDLLGLGARLWRQHRADLDARPTPDDEADATTRAGRLRDPEGVASALEATLRGGAHLVRRARWLRRLCEASLLWRSGPDRRRLLILERGRVTAHEDVAPGVAAPLPPGGARASLERLRCFDAATYDRLRVLTTELRRVVAGGGPIELRLGPRQRLDRDGLARRLYWV
ncbi:MAG: GIY-YIG nuclease family protein [Planctomycetota bacterium]